MATGREVWEPRVRRLGESDLTVKEFAAELGINPGTLSYWKWRLGKEVRNEKPRPKRKVKAPTFVEVTAVAARAAAREPIELVLDGRVVVRVPDDFEAATLRRIVAALGSQSE